MANDARATLLLVVALIHLAVVVRAILLDEREPYRAGLLHAKTLVVDERVALVGSANMDRRSLDLIFENNVLFEGAALAAAVSAHQRR